MAENKKGFILYADQKELFEQLTDELAGKLIKHIFKYVNDENPTSDDMIVNIAFTPIKQQLKRDLKKFEETRKQRSDAGKRSAEVRKKQRTLTPLNTVQRTSTKSTDKDNVNDKVTDKDIYNKNVFLSNVEYNDLIKKIGKEKTTEYIARLSSYMLSRGKNYHSHYNTLLI